MSHNGSDRQNLRHRQSSSMSNIVDFYRRYLSASHHTLVTEAAGRRHASSAANASTAESSVCFRGEGGGDRHVLNREAYGVTGQHSCHTTVENDVCLGREHHSPRPKFSFITRNSPLAMTSQVRDGSNRAVKCEVTAQRWFQKLTALVMAH